MWGKQSTETLWIGPDVEVGKDFKEAVTNVFKEANYVQKLNKNMMTSDSINRKSKKKNTSHKKNQRPVLKQKI